MAQKGMGIHKKMNYVAYWQSHLVKRCPARIELVRAGGKANGRSDDSFSPASLCLSRSQLAGFFSPGTTQSVAMDISSRNNSIHHRASHRKSVLATVFWRTRGPWGMRIPRSRSIFRCTENVIIKQIKTPISRETLPGGWAACSNIKIKATVEYKCKNRKQFSLKVVEKVDQEREGKKNVNLSRTQQ